MSDDADMFTTKLSIGADAIRTGLECGAVVLIALRDGVAHSAVALDPAGPGGAEGVRVALMTALGAVHLGIQSLPTSESEQDQ